MTAARSSTPTVPQDQPSSTSPADPPDAILIQSERPQFVMIPLWIGNAAISDRAMRLYYWMRQKGDYRTLEVWGSRKRLAELLKCSLRSFDRAMEELEELGAVEVTRTFNKDKNQHFPNKYLVRETRPQGVAHQCATLRVGGDTLLDSQGAAEAEPKPRPGRAATNGREEEEGRGDSGGDPLPLSRPSTRPSSREAERSSATDSSRPPLNPSQTARVSETADEEPRSTARGRSSSKTQKRQAATKPEQVALRIAERRYESEMDKFRDGLRDQPIGSKRKWIESVAFDDIALTQELHALAETFRSASVDALETAMRVLDSEEPNCRLHSLTGGCGHCCDLGWTTRRDEETGLDYRELCSCTIEHIPGLWEEF